MLLCLRLNAAPQQYLHLPTDLLQSRMTCRHTSTGEGIMASHRRNKSEADYDSDDMSAGARLMRYYVSDKPRADTLSVASSTTARTESQRPTNSNTLSGEQQVTAGSTVSHSTARARLDAGSTTKPERKDNKKTKDDDDDDNEDGDSDDTVFRGDLAEFKGDVLFDIVGRYSHQEILEKISTFHPEATFGQKQLTWRIANMIVARANRQGVTKLKVRAELDALRIANRVEFPKNYRPKSQGEHGGSGGKEDATVGDDGDDDDDTL